MARDLHAFWLQLVRGRETSRIVTQGVTLRPFLHCCSNYEEEMKRRPSATTFGPTPKIDTGPEKMMETAGPSTPPTVSDPNQTEKSLIDIAVESWRFSRLFARVVSKLDAGEAGRYTNQLRYFQKKVEESLAAAGLQLVNIEGQPFDPGMAASALNIADFGPDDTLLVDQMLEPIIMDSAGLKKQGTVMLRKAHI